MSTTQSNDGVIGDGSPAPAVVFQYRQARLTKKASLVNLDAWCKLLLTLDGRDKVTKILQYVCRFLAYWYSGQSSASAASTAAAAAAAAVERFNAFKTSLSTSRKAFRLGRSLIEWKKLQDLVPQLLELLLGRTLQQRHCAKQSSSNNSATTASMDNVVASSLKTVGLLGFWAADNVSFLAQGGLLDDYTNLTTTARLERRNLLVTKASALANQSYFVGAVAGFVANWNAYWKHRTQTTLMLSLEVESSAHDDNVSVEETSASKVSVESLQRTSQEEWTLLLSLIKSACDVFVFSNNPGVDLWRTCRNGRPMHEGFHCLCGLVSASTVVYANYPAHNP